MKYDGRENRRDRFYPGRDWTDTAGKRIQAHGGSIFIDSDGRIYWYGENKERTDGKNGIWHWGVRYYESTDLYNWTDRGILIPPEEDDPDSTLHPSSMADRPHILYNAATGKYVCWIKIMERDGQSMTVLTADRFAGPYTKVREHFRPNGMNAGDFDLCRDEAGRGYIYFEKVHTETVCAELSADYTDVNGTYSSHFPHPEGPPAVREATAHFIRKGRHYLLTSGTTGYRPNPAEAAAGDGYHGPFTVLKDPCPDDPTRTTFHSQISSVFRVPWKKDLYIALADRWMPALNGWTYDGGGSDADSVRRRIMAYLAAVGVDPRTDPQAARERAREVLDAGVNTSLAGYVWLPLRFDEEGNVTIRWADEWSLDDFA